MAKELKIGSHTVTIKNVDFVLFPHTGITKGDLIKYYQKIAPLMIPHIKNRPITMHRFPEGIDSEGFIQKNTPDYFPDWIVRQPVKRESDGVVDYVLCNNEATLVYLANQACITPHVWLSRTPKLDYPDRMIFDLDPSKGVGFAGVVKIARAIKDVLEELELPHFVMTTGSRGVHVVIPLKKTMLFDDVRDCARTIAQIVVARHPKEATLEIRKEKRGKRVFVDTLRNAWAQTGVAPYAVRAIEGAPIATPIEWSELFKKGMEPQKYTISNIGRRIKSVGDLWADIEDSACSLTRACAKAQSILEEEEK